MIKLERPGCPNPSVLAAGNYKHPDNKEALKKSAYDKCMYCESKISHIDFAHVEHIKPKDKFKNLEFDWNNLGYACPKCNNEKSNKYCNDTPFLNPYAEDPQEHLYAFGAMLWPKKGSERGGITIKEIDLNRPGLLEKRSERLDTLQKAIDACYRTQNQQLRNDSLKSLQAEAENNREYSIFAKAMLDSHNT